MAGRTYVIDLRGSPTDDGTLSDPYLRGIHDAEGHRISNTTNDDGGRGYNSRVTFTPEESGTYFARVSGDRNETGTYTLTVTDMTAPETDGSTTDPVTPEPQEATVEFVGPDQDAQEQPQTSPAQGEQVSVSEGDTDLPADTTTTGRVVVGGSATGEVEARGDQDWFAVELEAGKTYRFDLKGLHSGDGTLYDPYLHGIYDAGGERFPNTTADQGGVSHNSLVHFTPDEDGTYYVEAGGVHRHHVGTYTLGVTEVTDDYAAEPGSVAVDDSLEFDPQADYAAGTGTGSVAVGGSARGKVDYWGDEDWFAVELEADTTYRFDLDGTRLGYPLLWNPYLRGIHDADGALIDGTENDENGGESRNEMYFTPDEDGTYYVAAGAEVGWYGTYTLSVEEAVDGL